MQLPQLRKDRSKVHGHDSVPQARQGPRLRCMVHTHLAMPVRSSPNAAHFCASTLEDIVVLVRLLWHRRRFASERNEGLHKVDDGLVEPRAVSKLVKDLSQSFARLLRPLHSLLQRWPRFPFLS